MKIIKKMFLIVLSVVMMLSMTTLAVSAAGSPTRKSIKKAKATTKTVKYDGKLHSPKVTVTLGKKTLKAGTDYTVSKLSKRTSGTYKVTIKGIGLYKGTVETTFKIKGTATKKQNAVTAKLSKKTSLKASALKKKSAAVKVVVTKNKANKGKVTYSVSKTSKSLRKYITVSKSGKVTLKKGAKKGTYKVTVKVAGYKKFDPVTKTVTIKVL